MNRGYHSSFLVEDQLWPDDSLLAFSERENRCGRNRPVCLAKIYRVPARKSSPKSSTIPLPSGRLTTGLVRHALAFARLVYAACYEAGSNHSPSSVSNCEAGHQPSDNERRAGPDGSLTFISA
jgi:hypothetical protein